MSKTSNKNGPKRMLAGFVAVLALGGLAVSSMPPATAAAKKIELGTTPRALDGSMIDHHVRIGRQLRTETLRATLLALALPDPITAA